MIFLILPLLAAILPAAIAALGSIGGSVIQRGQSKNDIRTMNEYNNPANQLARLREAGLPYAAFAAGQSGSQSSLPTSTDVGLKEAGRSIGNYVSTQLQQKQLELLQEQIHTQQMTTLKTGAEYASIANLNNVNTADPDVQTNPGSYQMRLKDIEYRTAKAQQVISENQSEIVKIDAQVKKDLNEKGVLSALTIAQLDNLVNQVTLGKQEVNRGKIMDILINQLKKGGISTSEAFLHSIITGGIGVSKAIK